MISTGRLDRHRTILRPEGASWAHLLTSSPGVAWEHSKDPTRGSVPVAQVRSIQRTGRGLEAEVVFEDDDFSRMIYSQYKSGSLRSFSVEFLPIKAAPPSKRDIEAHPDWRGAELVFHEWELYGLSAVRVPSNVGAVATAVRSAPAPRQTTNRDLTADQLASLCEYAMSKVLPGLMATWRSANPRLAKLADGWPVELIDREEQLNAERMQDTVRSTHQRLFDEELGRRNAELMRHITKGKY